jgi:hypothetical protein
MIGTLMVRISGRGCSARFPAGCSRPARARRPCLDEQLVEPLVAIANRLAIDFEDVAELHPEVLVAELDEQQIGLELAALARLRRARRRRPAGGS